MTIDGQTEGCGHPHCRWTSSHDGDTETIDLTQSDSEMAESDDSTNAESDDETKSEAVESGDSEAGSDDSSDKPYDLTESESDSESNSDSESDHSDVFYSESDESVYDLTSAD